MPSPTPVEARRAEEEERQEAFEHSWRFAQRASPAFERLVEASFLAVVALLVGAVVLFSLSLYKWLIADVVLTAAAFTVFKFWLRAMRRTVVAEETRWARARANHIVGFVDAVGDPESGNGGVLFRVDLEREVPKEALGRLADQLVAIAPNGRLEKPSARQLEIRTGKVPLAELMGVYRAVLDRFLPELREYGVGEVRVARA